MWNKLLMNLRQPWTIHDAEVELWPAWKDGMPFRGPGTGRGRPEPVMRCKSSLTIDECWEPSAPTGHGWMGVEAASGKRYEIAVGFPDGAMADELGRIASRLATKGFHILVVRFLAAGGEWTCLTFFHVVPRSEGLTEASEVMGRTLRLAAGWMQETVGSSDAPSMPPKVFGEVEWICGARRVLAMRYDPVTEIWQSLPENETGDGSRYVTMSPEGDAPGADVIVAYQVPRAVENDPIFTITAPDGVLPGSTLYSTEIGPLPSLSLGWENRVAFRVGGADSALHHGLLFYSGYELQAEGIVEPLLYDPQDRMIDEPVVVFRYLGRVYAVLGHGVLAVPAVTPGSAPLTHDPAFRIGPAVASPEGGLVLLADGGWVDGTVG